MAVSLTTIPSGSGTGRVTNAPELDAHELVFGDSDGWPEIYVLTRRQLEVLQLLADGLVAKEIAVRLQLSPKTVLTHYSGIHQRMGTHSLPHAVATGLRQRLIR